MENSRGEKKKRRTGEKYLNSLNSLIWKICAVKEVLRMHWMKNRDYQHLPAWQLMKVIKFRIIIIPLTELQLRKIEVN